MGDVMYVNDSNCLGCSGQDQDRPTHDLARWSLPVPFLPRHYAAGDLVASVTHAAGFVPCAPCEARRVWLNQHVQFRPWGDR
jgi:hypothetical protein